MEFFYLRYTEYEAIPLNTDFSYIDKELKNKVGKRNICLLRDGDLYTVRDYINGNYIERLYIVRLNELRIKHRSIFFWWNKKYNNIESRYFLSIDKIAPINDLNLMRDRFYMEKDEDLYLAFCRYCDVTKCGVPIAVSHLDPILHEEHNIHMG